MYIQQNFKCSNGHRASNINASRALAPDVRNMYSHPPSGVLLLSFVMTTWQIQVSYSDSALPGHGYSYPTVSRRDSTAQWKPSCPISPGERKNGRFCPPQKGAICLMGNSRWKRMGRQRTKEWAGKGQVMGKEWAGKRRPVCHTRSTITPAAAGAPARLSILNLKLIVLLNLELAVLSLSS